ncbi:MAG: glycogen/starch/alpha-glucan phosphorylase [Oscillospiraceae bacterium]|nr:glycogen/starch/alpha-glucan phosphorylase [Oscillospiraceae bacterium]
MKKTITKATAKELLDQKLLHYFGVTGVNATYEQFYRALALILKDMMSKKRADFDAKADTEEGCKRVYYLSMEFLMGRSLKNTLYNLNLTKVYENVLAEYGVSLEKVYECEPDAGLGNGGLGRLAACYLDALATGGYPARGYSILYEYGIFKQKLVDGWQYELPDSWLPGGDVWITKREESAVNILFEGRVVDSWDNNHHQVEIVDANIIRAVPSDMFVAGKDGKGVSVLRLWSAEAPGLDMKLFNEGQYIKATEQDAMAKTISKILYPADNHYEGKSLRLKQQYFLVSASIQDIIHNHLHRGETIDSIPSKIAIHINDTHPTLAIPELMRILLDECGYGWDDAWNIVTSTIAYTNHTVMAEALEKWPEGLIKQILPRIYQIIKEIDNRLRHFVWESSHDASLVERTAVISDGVVKMANLCVAACHSVNGVSALHSDILKDSVFNDFYRLTPDKFTNVTNGIAHRRWLCQANPALTAYLTKKIGDGFIYDGSELKKFAKFADEKEALAELQKIKRGNKEKFAKYIKETTGETLDPDSLFDVQVKRLHEYKRQELNALSILANYIKIKNNPNGNYIPHTYIFGAKAAPSYIVAKKIISFICALAKTVNSDPDVNKYLKVLFIEDYNVTAAERLMPAADISEQISLAGTEASGTGNMKLMINGAVTLGTMDGANIEIYENVGADNIIIFGMSTPEVNELKYSGYTPMNYYRNSPELRETIDYLNAHTFAGQNFPEIGETIKFHDPYMVLADFADYRLAQAKAEELFAQKDVFARMSLMNIAGAGFFAADRAISEYADKIWRTKGIKK